MCTLVCTTNVARLMRKIHVIGSTLGPRGACDKRENLLKSGCATHSKTQKTEKHAKPATVVMVMRIVWICGDAFSFAFAHLKGNSGCPSDDALACHGLLSIGYIFPNIF